MNQFQWRVELGLLIRELMRGDDRGHFPLSEIRAIALALYSERWSGWDISEFQTAVDIMIRLYMPRNYSPVKTVELWQKQ